MCPNPTFKTRGSGSNFLFKNLSATISTWNSLIWMKMYFISFFNHFFKSISAGSYPDTVFFVRIRIWQSRSRADRIRRNATLPRLKFQPRKIVVPGPFLDTLSTFSTFTQIAAHCPINILNARIKSKPVAVGADATVYVGFLCQIYWTSMQTKAAWTMDILFSIHYTTVYTYMYTVPLHPLQLCQARFSCIDTDYF